MILRRVVLGALHERRLPLDTEDFAGAPRERQREIPDAAEQVEQAVVRTRFEQLYRLADHGAVDVGIHLHEIDRFEFDACIELRQHVVKRFLVALRMQGPQ